MTEFVASIEEYVDGDQIGMESTGKYLYKRFVDIKRIEVSRAKRSEFVELVVKVTRYQLYRLRERAYGGSRCANCVKDRIVRAFLIEEQKLVKQLVKQKVAAK